MEGARRATVADLPRLVQLWHAAQAELGALRGGDLLHAQAGRSAPVGDSFAAELDDPAHGVWAGTIDATVVGYAAGRIELLRDGTCLGAITDLFVEPETRAVGVGEALMDQLLTWFAARGCLGVDALALPGHRATKNFFEESGFTARLLVMHHRFDG